MGSISPTPLTQRHTTIIKYSLFLLLLKMTLRILPVCILICLCVRLSGGKYCKRNSYQTMKINEKCAIHFHQQNFVASTPARRNNKTCIPNVSCKTAFYNILIENLIQYWWKSGIPLQIASISLSVRVCDSCYILL